MFFLVRSLDGNYVYGLGFEKKMEGGEMVKKRYRKNRKGKRKTRWRLEWLIIGMCFFGMIGGIIIFPKLIFKITDQRREKKSWRKELQLQNIYTEEQLSNNKKIEILSRGEFTQLLFQEQVSKDKYTTVIENVLEELKKIDATLGEEFQKNYMPEYEIITDLIMAQSYISCDNYDSLTLRLIHYYTKEIEVEIAMDIYGHTILSFLAHKNWDILNDQKEDYVKEGEVLKATEFAQKIMNYLQLNSNLYEASGYFGKYIISFPYYYELDSGNGFSLQHYSDYINIEKDFSFKN